MYLGWAEIITTYVEYGFKMTHLDWELLVVMAKKDGVTLHQPEVYGLTMEKIE